MNWDAIGAVGEIIGALGVILSVIYLAAQVKKQTNESQMAATRDLSSQLTTAIEPIVADPKYAVIWGKAVQDLNSLEPAERLWVTILLNRQFNIAQQQMIHASKSHVDAQHHQSFSRQLEEVMSFPGVQTWWAGSRNTFCDDFQAFVDGYLEKPKHYDSSFSDVNYRAS